MATRWIKVNSAAREVDEAALYDFLTVTRFDHDESTGSLAPVGFPVAAFIGMVHT